MSRAARSTEPGGIPMGGGEPAGGHGGSPSHGTAGYWWYQARSALLERALARYAVGSPHVLDLGSADGPSAAWVQQRAGHIASLDIDPRGLPHNGICGSGTALPFADASFDLVSAFDVIEHLAPEQLALAEIHRVLRPGGVLLMAVPAYQWAWTDHDIANGHHRRYTRARAVAAVTASGFVVERATYAFAATFPMFAVERLARRALGSREQQARDVASVPTLPRPVHRALLGVCRVDEVLLARMNLPFGSSVFLAARKPG